MIRGPGRVPGHPGGGRRRASRPTTSWPPWPPRPGTGSASVIVVTGDRDSYQLVEDPYVRVLYNRRGVSDYALYDEAGDRGPHRGAAGACTRCWRPCAGTPPTTSPACRAWGRRRPPSWSTSTGTSTRIYAHLDALSPKLRENLADQPRPGAEERRGHPAGARRAARRPRRRPAPSAAGTPRWPGRRSSTSSCAPCGPGSRRCMKDGLLGRPAGGHRREPRSGRAVPPGRPGSVGEGGPDPAWLTEPEVVIPAGPSLAAESLAATVAAARAGTGNLAVHPRWSADPGRSPLSALTLVPEPAEPDASVGAVLHLAGGETGVLDAPEVAAALAGAFGPDGVGVVGHDVKELMRSLLPRGVDITALVMDTAVAAYLLDSSSRPLPPGRPGRHPPRCGGRRRGRREGPGGLRPRRR